MGEEVLYDHERTLRRLRERVAESDLRPANRKLLLEFEKFCLAEGLSVRRRIKLLQHSYTLASRYLPFPFKKATARRIREAVATIEQGNHAPWTKHDYKVVLRKLFKFVFWGDRALDREGYPACVAGVSTRIRRKDQVRIRSTDILTEEEAETLIAAASNSQERAFLSLTYELGARIEEVATMRIKHVTRDEYSYLCDIYGKTGHRSCRIIRSAGSLTAWLNSHPRRTDPEAFLWGHLSDRSWVGQTYFRLSRTLKTAALEAGVTKRVYPHLLRHSRITHVLAGGQMNEAQTKKYFGHSPDSRMFVTYSHLVSRDANDAVLRMHGIRPDRDKSRGPPPACGMCGEINERTTLFCARCGYPLHQSAVEDAASRVEKAQVRVLRYLKRPDVEDDFRRAIREEVREEVARALADVLPPQSARRTEPTPARELA